MDLAEELDEIDLTEKAKKYRSAYVKAAETGKHQWFLTGQPVAWQFLDPDFASTSSGNEARVLMSEGPMKAATSMLQLQPELQHLPALLKAKYPSLPGALETLPNIIRVVRTAVLAAAVPWAHPKAELQSVRAAAMHYGAEWFDSVWAQGEEAGVGLVDWVGQLRLLFRLGDRQLALVRWYTRVVRHTD